MKLATRRTAAPDGELMAVSTDLARMTSAGSIAPTLQAALENWNEAAPRLAALCAQLDGDSDRGEPCNGAALAAPLPRAWQWLDGSAFPSHGKLMETAFRMPPIETDRPLMYQGMSHVFLGPHDQVVLPSEADGIDFEAELAIVTDFVPMGTKPEKAIEHIKLALLVNDWSLRAIAPSEMKTGFGWIGAKPACSAAPFAVSIDALGSAWLDDGRIDLVVAVAVNGSLFGRVGSTQMEYGFGELVAHAARTRDLCAGTIIGSGTVSSSNSRQVGSCCVAERRAIEMIDEGAARTPFLRHGDAVRISAETADGTQVFGTVEQIVAVAGR